MKIDGNNNDEKNPLSWTAEDANQQEDDSIVSNLRRDLERRLHISTPQRQLTPPQIVSSNNAVVDGWSDSEGLDLEEEEVNHGSVDGWSDLDLSFGGTGEEKEKEEEENEEEKKEEQVATSSRYNDAPLSTSEIDTSLADEDDKEDNDDEKSNPHLKSSSQIHISNPHHHGCSCLIHSPTTLSFGK